MPIGSRFKNALAEWRDVLGARGVILSEAELTKAATATFSTSQEIPAILKPINVSQVQACLRIATRHHVPFYPISTGKNWGYGSRVPTIDNCILLDLGEMRAIVDFNESLGYVTVEPGVTQAQLFAFLKERKSKLWIDATGSSPDCSLIGNALERGFGHTPYGDHFDQICSLEVVLPNGELLETGFSRASGVAAAPVYRPGIGPSLEGLFVQSNLGVVTKMTLWLMPAPEYFEAFFFTCNEDDGLGPIIDALRPLRMNATLRSAVHIANDYKVIAGIQQYPWDEMRGKTPLRPADMRTFRKRLRIGAWSGSGGLYGTRAQVAEARRLVKRALKGKVQKLHFLNNTLLHSATRFSRSFHLLTRIDLRRTLSLVRPVYGLMQGIPTKQSLFSVYWRKRRSPPPEPDPDADLCGLQWFAPVAPAEGTHAKQITAIASSILLKHGFEPALSFTLLTERAFVCVISLAYDREIEGEDERAASCYQNLVEALMAKGYAPYRLGIQSMDLMHLNAPTASLIHGIKDLVDPAHVLAPRRYQPSKNAGKGNG